MIEVIDDGHGIEPASRPHLRSVIHHQAVAAACNLRRLFARAPS